MRSARGITLLELLVVLAIGALLLTVALPAAAYVRNAGRAAAGARYLATEFQAERWRSVSLRKSGGFFFERTAGGWSWHRVEDGNGNGLRTNEVRKGVDPVLSGPHRLEDRIQGVGPGFPPGGPFPKIPPETGPIADTSDPVQFGPSDLVSFSPIGSSSSGTLYLTDGRDALYGIVLYGPSVRIRVWRYDARSGRWTR
jgi:prepilin-type N-terminal cleavage/methylation domain-containing protein